jgi:hypothetical protein
MSNDTKGKGTTQEDNKKQKPQHHRFYGKKPEADKKETIPMLKYGKGNNFYAFQQALAKRALRDFGDLGKLITDGEYYTPELTLMDPTVYRDMGLTADEITMLRMEALKDHVKYVERMKQDRPKLYGLMLEHISVESKDEICQVEDYDVWSKRTDPEKLWQAIVQTHKVDCVSNVNQVKQLTARKAYQNIKQGPFESLAQYSERFRETYRVYKETNSKEDSPVDIAEADQAMDFFHGLDQGRYGVFKTNMLNGWATGAFDPPNTVNAIYRIAGTWVKPVPRGEGGSAVTYITIEEDAKQQNKKRQQQKHQKKAAAATAEEASDDAETQPKDRSKYKCWSCGEKGHLANSKLCPNKKKKEEGEGVVNTTWQEYEASMFMTMREFEEEYIVNNAVNVTQALLPTEILLDNQADVSIVNPILLKNVEKAQKKIKIKGVGGVQLIVDQVGFMEGFFQVYASSDTKANVLSFADVEDLYEITYVQREAFVVHMLGKDLVFRRRDKLYVADWSDVGTVTATIQENERLYSKNEVDRAKEAHQLIKNCGYPSGGEAAHILTDGNVRGLPKLAVADIPEEHPAENQDSEMEQLEFVEIAGEENQEREVEQAGEETRTRSGRLVVRPSRFAAVTKVHRSEWKEEACDKAIRLELKQLFEELKALRVVRRTEATKSAKVLKSHMFLVRKYLANGNFDKVKARLVADGRDQDAEMYPDKASPTVAIQSVFTVLGLAATKPWQIVVKIDVKGAFVQTPMEGEPIYMKLDPKISQVAAEMYPKLKDYVEGDGCIYTHLLKAMYGCVQASALWYRYIRRELENMGYTACETDRCVFRKQVGDRLFLALLYVDDILAIVDKREAERLRTKLIEIFGTVQFEIGNKLSYLGMEIEVTDAGTTIDMSFYVEELLKGYDVVERWSPAKKTWFVVGEDSKILSEATRKLFHSTTAKLLYLAKRARPDILTAVTYLCTRVQGATVEDMQKLERVLGYLKHTKSRTLLLRTPGTLAITAYVDAAYALHGDSKSHTGVVIYIGRTLVYVASRKQKCMCKSPTEAELVALTDNLGLIELFHEFLEFVTNHKMQIPVVYQDCNAVVSLVTKGGGVTRTKHLRARMHLAKEMVDQRRVEIKYLNAEAMIADGFSKPYDPVEHEPFARKIQGEE